ncbi:MAG: hypothetical protein J6P98_01590 [Clostridia bacterium]|nr:hypothetical protein [Clostridia bacterium]
MKKTIALIMILLFCLPASGCIFGLEKHTNTAPGANEFGEGKVFTGEGYTVTLTDKFEERKSSQGFDGYYVSSFCGVMVKKEPFASAEGRKNLNLSQYLVSVAENNEHKATVTEEDGLTYYRYYRDGNAGWLFGFEGEDSYYLVQFVCREDHEEALNDQIFAFARSVTVK